ncbi:MAG: WbuC family cupin fold metalloprotein [Bacteroidota bacterium]
MIKINQNLLQEIIFKARISTRRRMNYNFHEKASDTLQRMINVMIPGTYVQPHKHENPGKREVFIILKGKAWVIEFDDMGNINESYLMDPSLENYAVEIPPSTWHMIIPVEESVFYELKDGPYDPNSDKVFASWAPPETSPGKTTFVEEVLKSMKSK